jgi:hypothetical protein
MQLKPRPVKTSDCGWAQVSPTRVKIRVGGMTQCWIFIEFKGLYGVQFAQRRPGRPSPILLIPARVAFSYPILTATAEHEGNAPFLQGRHSPNKSVTLSLVRHYSVFSVTDTNQKVQSRTTPPIILRCRGNVLTEPLNSNDRETGRLTHRLSYGTTLIVQKTKPIILP